MSYNDARKIILNFLNYLKKEIYKYNNLLLNTFILSRFKINNPTENLKKLNV